MSGVFLFLLAVLSFIGLLVFLILTIVYLSGGNQRKGTIFGAMAGACLIFGISSVVFLVDRTTSKIRTEFADAWDEIKEESRVHSEARAQQQQIINDSLFAMVPDELKSEVPPDFYDTRFTDLGKYWIPMVYPFGISADVYFEWGALVQGVNEDKEILFGVTHFAFDRNWVLCKVDNYPDADNMEYTNYEKPPFYFAAFNTRNERLKEFTNEKDLWSFAESKGYNGQEYLSSLDEAYNTRR